MKGQLTTGFGGNSISLRDGASALFRRRGLVLFIFITVVLGTALLTWILPNKYESRMKILVKNQRVDVAITPEATSGTPGAVDGEVSESAINSEIELLTSRDLLTQVAKETGLGQAGSSMFWKRSTSEPERIEKAANDLAKELVIAPVKKANVISISYSANSPELAAAVLQKLGELYLEKHLKLHHPTGASDFFKEKADQYETQLHDSEKQLTSFQQDNELIVLAQQKDLTLQKTAEAKAKLLESETAFNEATNRIKRIEQQLATTPKRIVTQSKSIPAQYSAERLNTMMVELQNRRTQLLTKFRPDDRLVREVDAQIRTTKEALARAESQTATEQQTDLNPLRQTLETEYSRARLEQTGAQARRDTLSAQLRDYEGELRKLEGDTTRHDDLQRQKKEAEENYQLYAKKREEARIADELDRQKITNVSIAEAPAAPRIPSSPNRPLNLLLGVFVATFLSLGTVFSAEMLGGTIHTPRQLEALTGATVLATVPENSRRQIGGSRKKTKEIDSAAQLESHSSQ
ncbi:MAG TPA: Wzz/FepE/Etk N-terminal domain-containing protein [Pyrinomonadaceae bacterium]|nr:Wzz/FepE/Etk N-terminal domain-containing protein [Pyrinomonadaceae bacterium]